MLLRIAVALTLSLTAFQTAPAFAQSNPERFWLAGRYDGNRIIVYFDAVKFGDTFPKDAGIIAYPIADAFFDPMELRPEYVARFQKGPQSEHFAIGDRYDLLLGDSSAALVTLTSLVGFAADEAVGNDSFIGALAEIDQPERLLFNKNYYVVRRHVEVPDNPPPKFDPKAPIARLESDPVPFDIESKIAALVIERMKTAGIPANIKSQAEKVSPALSVQRFTLADGSTRYYVWAHWEPANHPATDWTVGLGAWISPAPALHILAVDPPGGVEKQNLLNVVDLGKGRTGIVVYIQGEDSRGIRLVEYKDGLAGKHMRLLHSIATGE